MTTQVFKNYYKKQAGSSLLEALVAVLVVSFGILGLIGLQTKAASMSIAAEDRTRAAILANEFVSTMQLTRKIPEGNVLEVLQARASELKKGGLPNGEFITEKINEGLVSITVQWDVSNIKNKDAQTAKYTTLATLP